MSLEQKINYQLNKYPAIKKIVKSVYQHVMYAISPKIKSEGSITRISPDDHSHEFFFGYYDKSPWDITDRYMLCMKANNTWSDVSPREKADILLIDTQKSESDPERVKKIAETRAWNVQQSCMLQWLGPDYSRQVIYNDYRNGRYVSVILTLETMEEKVIPAAVYSVSVDGTFALTLDFSRLYNLRPGYGYYNVPEKTKGIALPDTTAIWKVDLETGGVTDLLKYTDFASFQSRPEMQEDGAVHKVNHIMISPNGKRFMVLYRWFIGERKYTRLITCNVDGTDMYILSDDDMVSHCFWKDDEHIMAFENKKKSGIGYYLMKDKTQEYVHCWPEMVGDGHPSYSPNNSLIVTDTYPNRARIAELKVMNEHYDKDDSVKVIARVFAPFKYDNDIRCDLHPRWNHAGDKICFDSVHEGHRGLYIVNANMETERTSLCKRVASDVKVSCIIPSYKRCDTVTRAIDSVLNQTYKNIEVCIVDDNEPGDEYSLRLQEALEKYRDDARVRYISQKKHINGAVARNVGINAATGEIIGFLDDDDEWLPEKISKQIQMMQENPSMDGVTTLWTQFKNGEKIRKCSLYSADNLQFKIFLRDVAVFTSTVVIKKSSIQQFGGFDEKLLRHQDLQFLIDALEKSNFGVVPEYLVRLHTDSAINRPNVEKLICAKQAFFESVNDRFINYSKSNQIRIRNAHYYEIVFQAIKVKDYKNVIKYLLKAGLNPDSIRDLVKRVKER